MIRSIDFRFSPYDAYLCFAVVCCTWEAYIIGSRRKFLQLPSFLHAYLVRKREPKELFNLQKRPEINAESPFISCFSSFLRFYSFLGKNCYVNFARFVNAVCIDLIGIWKVEGSSVLVLRQPLRLVDV